jgi:hypothetical protein
MIEPTTREEEVYALLLSNRGRVTDLAAYREELRAASAQSADLDAWAEDRERRIYSGEVILPDSAEPQEAEAWDPLETLAAAVKVLWDDVRMIVTKDSACSRWHEDAILALAALRARLASKPSQDERSRIVASAIRLNGVTFTGFRHHTIIGYLADCGFPTPIGGEEGFIDDTGRFLSRKDAADLALRVGQINKTLMPNGELDSADIFPRRARSRREEEMREVLAEIERYARASLCNHRGGSPDVGSCPNCKSYLHLIELARAALAQGGARDEGEGEVKQMLG